MAKVTKDIAGAPIPTPVVLLTTVDEAGKPNIITLAWVGVVCSEPLTISAAIRPPRYSHMLLKECGEAVVNVPSFDLLEQVDKCGMVSGRDEDKFKATGLTAVPAEIVKPPLIAECAINLETKLKSVTSLGTHDLFLLEVVRTHIDNALMDGNRFNPGAARMFCYLGTSYLAQDGEVGYYGFTKKL